MDKLLKYIMKNKVDWICKKCQFTFIEKKNYIPTKCPCCKSKEIKKSTKN